MSKPKPEIVTLYAIDRDQYSFRRPGPPEIVALENCKITEKQIRAPAHAALGFRSTVGRNDQPNSPGVGLYRSRGAAAAAMIRELETAVTDAREGLEIAEEHLRITREKYGLPL